MDILGDLKKGVVTTSAEETEELGEQLAGVLPENSALALQGDLGSGKTTLVRGIARGLGIQSNVTSPTYSIYTTYVGNRQLLHMDAYRLTDAHQLDSLTIDEFLKPPYLLVVEWPDHIPGFFADYRTCFLELDILKNHAHRIVLVEK